MRGQRQSYLTLKKPRGNSFGKFGTFGDNMKPKYYIIEFDEQKIPAQLLIDCKTIIEIQEEDVEKIIEKHKVIPMADEEAEKKEKYDMVIELNTIKENAQSIATKITGDYRTELDNLVKSIEKFEEHFLNAQGDNNGKQ